MIKNKSKNNIIKKIIALSFILVISQNFSAQAIDSSSTSKADETSTQRVRLLNILNLPTEVQTYMLHLFFQDIISSDSIDNQEKKFEKVRSELTRIGRVNKQFYAIIHDSKFTINLIRLIEQKYNVSEIEAAMLLSTEAAGEFIKEKLENNIQNFDELNNLFIEQLKQINLNSDPSLSNIKFLLKLNVNVNAKNDNDNTALIIAIFNDNVTLIKLLLAHNDIDVNVKTGRRHWVALMRAIFVKNVKMVELLLAHKKTDINIKDNCGKTPLIYISERISIKTEIIKLLLAHKSIGVNARNKDGRTALMNAINRNNITMVELLLAHKDIDINAQDNQGYTAFIWAASNNRISAAKLLLKYLDTNIDIKNNNGLNALDIAKERNNGEIIKLIKDRS